MGYGVAVTISGVAIKSPSSFKVSRYLVTDMTRNAAGLMHGQIIAKKRKIFLTYDAITGADLQVIFNVLFDNATTLFHTVTFLEDGTTRSYKMYVGEMSKALHRKAAGTGLNSGWIWKDVKFDLIEQ